MAEKLTTITYGESGVLNISLTNLAEQGLDFSNLVDARFALKVDADDEDVDAVFNKTTGGGVTIDQGNSLIKVDIDVADYGADKIERNKTYLMILLLDWGDGNFREDYDPNFERKLKALKDKWRANT